MRSLFRTALLSSVIVLGTVAIPANAVNAAGNVSIDSTNFPDSVFRSYVSKEFDTDKDGVLSASEIAVAKKINVSYKKVTSLKGIEFFTELTYISSYDNSFGSIDLSNNTKLEELYIGNSGLNSLDLTHNPQLVKLDCPRNNLTSLDLTKNTKLVTLGIWENELTSIDLSKNTQLTTIYGATNKLTALDVSKNTKLTYLDCCENQITSLDISNNTLLESVYCHDNKLTELDVNKNGKLKSLHTYKNQISYIDISKCSNLIDAYKNGKTYTSYDNPGTTDYVVGDTPNMYSLMIDDKTTVYTTTPTNMPTNAPASKPTTAPTAKPASKPTAKPTPDNGVYTLTLNYATVNLACGKTLQLKATGAPKGAILKWRTANPDIATVSSTGVVTAKQAGLVAISVWGPGGASDACTVQVMFKDVTNTKDFWFEPTYYLADRDIVKGYDKQTKFKPGNDCTRSQMVTFLWRLNQSPEPVTKTCKFKDVKKGSYYYKAVLWAVENGITTGITKTKFGPSGVCTRAQTVTFLWRMAGKPDPVSSKNKFTDVKSKDYFYKAVLWASEKKIVAGYKNKTFKPQGKCLRRQMVTFLYKYDKYINKKG